MQDYEFFDLYLIVSKLFFAYKIGLNLIIDASQKHRLCFKCYIYNQKFNFVQYVLGKHKNLINGYGWIFEFLPI